MGEGATDAMGGGNQGTTDMASELNWKTIDVATLGAKAAALWDAKREADKIAKQHREAFEQHVQALLADKLPKGKRLVCGYRFGKLSVALDDAKEAEKAKPTALTLAGALGL